MNKLKLINYEELDPGIRDVVKVLRENGFYTTDSGDGVSKTERDGVIDFPHVVMLPDEGDTTGIATADRLLKVVMQNDLPHDTGVIESSYDPTDGYILIWYKPEGEYINC
jgi:hypothetical protein